MKTEIGYYTVNQKIFTNKFDAVMCAKQTGAEIEWNFFDEKLSKVQWHIEPTASLDELYRIRAQQIRDQYDYIIVFCSGGADSNNVIRTFVNNNIHVDEVMGLAPMSGLRNWNFDPNNLDESNTISETKFALIPLLNEIAAKNPNIKITLNDFFEDIVTYKDDDWTFKACGNIVTVLTSHFTDVLKFPHIDKLVQQGKRIGLVYGTDKPIIRIADSGNLYLVLADAGINYLNMPAEREHPNVDRVLFYWTADLPELMVKQAHVIAKCISLPEYSYIQEYLRPRARTLAEGNFTDIINKQLSNNQTPLTKNEILSRYMPAKHSTSYTLEFSTKSAYQRSVVPFIYPSTYTKDIFQCQKVDSDAGFFTRDQLWVHVLHEQTKLSDMIKSGIKTLYNSIPEKYLNVNGTGFINHFKIYKFGNILDFNLQR